MRSVQDALYNWLTIKVVAEGRPDDKAAQETYELFDGILRQDHGVSHIEVERREDDEMYYVSYEKDGVSKSTRFPLELIDCYLEQMQREPEKFKNY
ncbi:hypothetical protein [Ectobacillus ponti]|uniref:Uncharacterized protein n=1 Tax=Ectobacillus ponti TaxID=2961894 RepID=A0AA41XDV3_9BACI|nr:hypothetical protein [Ectobacillus ponti]MCP8970291.1 hypothetical protein [Ectobacillus ponti]